MAQAVGISTGSISSYRNGKKEPRLSMIAKMANYLGVDCHYLMTGIQAKNYICSNELGLSEKALNTLNAADSDELDFISFLIENRISSNISVKAYGCAIDKSLIMALDKKYSTVGMHRDDVHKMIRESADVRNAFNEVKRLQERVDTRLWRCHKILESAVDTVS